MLFLYYFFREDLDAKAAFVTAIGALHDLHAFAKEEVLGRRSRIPVSCAGCLVIIRSLFARVDEVTSEKWRPRLDLTSSSRTQAPSLTLFGSLGIQPQTYKSGLQYCTRWSGPRDSRACLGLRELRRRLQCRRKYSVGFVRVCGCGIRKLCFS